MYVSASRAPEKWSLLADGNGHKGNTAGAQVVTEGNACGD
jgi:hypothetical protein